MAERLVWDLDGRDWPHRVASRFVDAAGLRWHVQQFPARTQRAPHCLLLHGTGAATHSWRDVAPLLQAAGLHVVACDLPGHGFTGAPPAAAWSRTFSLPGMAAALAQLLDTLRCAPDVVVGHSAGAALALRMRLDGLSGARLTVGLNAALLPWRGVPGRLFSPLARLMAAAPGVPQLFAWQADSPQVFARLVAGTGSQLDAAGQAWYRRLATSPAHVQAALAMMAHWDLPTLALDLARLDTPLHLVAGSADRTVPPDQAERVQRLLPGPVRRPVALLPGLGHLAHEEQPAATCKVLLQRLRQEGLPV